MALHRNYIDPRRMQELKDSRMIQEDHNEVANLPRYDRLHEFNQNTFVEHIGDGHDEIHCPCKKG